MQGTRAECCNKDFIIQRQINPAPELLIVSLFPSLDVQDPWLMPKISTLETMGFTF